MNVRDSVAFCFVVGFVLACSTAAAEPELAVLPAQIPAPADNPQTAEKVALGKRLFFDVRLSGNNQMSCATCHDPKKYYQDGLAGSQGSEGNTLVRNTPTVLNTAFFQRLTWDGRAASLEEQALGPITSPEEMNQPLDELERELNAVPEYVRDFRAVFGTEVTRDGIAKALAAFQRTLNTYNSPLDRYLAGDKSALSKSAQRGFEIFMGEGGCVRCHNGPLLSDSKLHRLGVAFKDQGLGAVTGKRADDYRFRTPSLRNIARTAPYMHDGSLKTLTDVVMFYYRDAPTRAPSGLSLDINPLVGQSFSEIPDLVAFLQSLTGDAPKLDTGKKR